MSRSPARLALVAGVLCAAACSAQLPEIPDVFDPEGGPAACRGKCDGGAPLRPAPALPAATLATLFAPYEDPLGVELALIHRVIEARAADPTPAYADGHNPFSIRYAVYNLRHPDIVSALADARDAGVDVQILIEADQLDPARDWNTADEYLVERGFTLVGDHRTLDDVTRHTADLVGIAGSGLMHLKTRLFRWRDPATGELERLVTGSMNPGDNAVYNDETLHYIEDPVIIARYVAKYEAVRDGRELVNVWDPAAAINVLFTPDGGEQAVDHIARLIDEEQEVILIAMFSLRNIRPTTGGKTILERLVDAHARGVKVVVVTDRKQSDGIDADGNQLYFDDPSEDVLRDGGVPVYEVLNRRTPFNAMHTKYGIFGLTRPVIVTDVSNWTRAGLGNGTLRARNDESILFIDSVALDGGVTAMRYLGNFLEIVHRYGTMGADGERPTEGPEPADVFAALEGQAAWPAVTVRPAARVHTAWGERVHLTGDADVLGDWTRAHPGWPLDTDASAYPQWTGTDLVLPLGLRARGKLVAVDGTRVRWEAGADRTLLVDPTDARVAGGDPAARRIDLSFDWR
jgi:hypothetical protein